MIQQPHSQTIQTCLHFLIGGLSGMFATAVIQPIDTLKVQIQVISEAQGSSLSRKNRSMLRVFKNIYETKGFSVLYRGLDSAVLRQLIYASARLGSYTWGIQKLKNNGHNIGTFEKVGVSMLSGIFGALVGNPFDVALIRRQATVTTGLPAYSNTYQAFQAIYAEQSIFGLWRGIQITMLRVLLINVGQLAGNQIITDAIRPFFSPGSLILPNLSAVLASFLTAFLSLPADNIKVKLQKQTPDSLLYTGIADCLKKTIQREGFTRLWVGFPVYLMRGTPHSFILIRTQQFLKDKFLNKE